MNCLLFIEMIYKNNFNITFPRDKHDLDNEAKNLRYLIKVPLTDVFDNEGWKRIDLINIKCYDILVFKDGKKDRIKHFGMYIDNNKFIHLPSESVSVISDFNEAYRKFFAGAVRHESLDI